MAWKIIVPKSPRGRLGGVYAVRVALHGRGKGESRLVFTFGKEFQKKMRWQIGDRMLIQYDDENDLIGIERHNSTGTYQLIASGGTKGNGTPIGKISIPADMIPHEKFVGADARVLAESDVLFDGDCLVICGITQ